MTVTHRFSTTILSAWLVLGALGTFAGPVAAQTKAKEDARQYVAFVEDFVGLCVSRNGVQILVKNTHPSRTLRVWLDRYHMGTGTGDRSRSLLKPGGEPEPLGCSRSLSGPQEWRIVRAAFVD